MFSYNINNTVSSQRRFPLYCLEFFTSLKLLAIMWNTAAIVANKKDKNIAFFVLSVQDLVCISSVTWFQFGTTKTVYVYKCRQKQKLCNSHKTGRSGFSLGSAESPGDAEDNGCGHQPQLY